MTFYDDIYPFYPLQRTPFIFSTSLLTVILVFLVLTVGFLLIVPGIRGKSVSVLKKLSLSSQVAADYLHSLSSMDLTTP